MAGHRHTPGIALFACMVAACSFDTSVKFEGQAANRNDAGALPPDAAGIADAGRELGPDAAPTPDAAPIVPDGTLQSFRRTQDVILDGELDAEWLTINFVDFAIADAELLETVPQYVADASARIASVYDDERIYFFVEVTDSIIVDDSIASYNDDSIEISIDGLNDRSGPLDDDDHWFVIAENGDYASLGPDEISIVGDVEATNIGYNIEIAIERDDLGDGNASLLGFNIALNDDDGHGTTAVDAYGLWHLPAAPECTDCCAGFNANYPWCDTTRLGQLQLMP